MFFSTIFTSILALSLGVSAAPVAGSTADIDPGSIRKVQLRLYGEPGCSAQNLGELGVYGDKVNKCQTFGADQVRSVRFENQLAPGCTRKLLSTSIHPLYRFRS